MFAYRKFTLTLRGPAVTASLAMLAFGCGFLTDSGASARSEVRIGLELGLESGQAAQGAPLSVIETVTLSVVPENGVPIDSVKPLSTVDPEATFAITVETGTVEFSAEVTSNNGSTLYFGSTAQEIRADGFQVTVPLQAVAPVMVVFPDSLDVGPGFPDSLEIANRGVGTLSWQISETTPPDTSCAGTCLTFVPTSGDLTADEAQFLTIEADSGATESFVVQLMSAQGLVDVRVTTFPLPPSRLAFNTQPGDAKRDSVILPPIEVAIQDDLGQTVTRAQDVVTITLGANPVGATLSGEVSVAAFDGIAVFDSLVIDTIGTGFTLVAQSGSLVSAESDSFDVLMPFVLGAAGGADSRAVRGGRAFCGRSNPASPFRFVTRHQLGNDPEVVDQPARRCAPGRAFDASAARPRWARIVAVYHE